MRYELRDGDMRSVLETDITDTGRSVLFNMRMDVYKGRFVKRYSNIVAIVEGDYAPHIRLQEFFQYLRRPEILSDYVRECERDEMRREGYYRALDQMQTGSRIW